VRPLGLLLSWSVRHADAQLAVLRDRAFIGLTARHLTDDHLWFTFFHEAGHVLLHRPTDTFVDELLTTATNPAEMEADAFAARALLSEGGLRKLDTVSLNMRSVIKLAHDTGVAPGIVVGQLQFHNRLGFDSSLNHLKRRYQWIGPNLGTA